MPFTGGDSVRVKDGVMCPYNPALSVGGWEGRILQIVDVIVRIQWDSVTLKQLPQEYIKRSEKEGVYWMEMYLSVDKIEPAKPRDSTDMADDVRKEMESLFSWLGEGEEGECIFNVIANADDPVEGWSAYLTIQLTFPFDAVVAEPQDRGPLAQRDDVTVHGICETDDLCGVLVELTHKGTRYLFPLCDLTVQDKNSSNHLPVHDYCVWFANR